jgi:putative phosphoesterase
MRIALISDIHANLPALDAVLADTSASSDIAAAYHLGDLVGYAPWPDEVVARLREMRIGGISGNYDSTVATDYKHCGCRYEDPEQEKLSHVSFEWTKKNASPETKLFLGDLPFRLDLAPLGGHLSGPRVGDTIAFGHTHLPWTRDVQGIHFVNAGSAGRPKDGDPRAGYVVLDVGADKTTVEFARVSYDVDLAARAIEASSLPNDFAAYLKSGGKKASA